MQKKKLTKRQRKAMAAPNAMCIYSATYGYITEVAGTEYFGKPKLLTDGIWTRPGIPFVRVHQKQRYTAHLG